MANQYNPLIPPDLLVNATRDNPLAPSWADAWQYNAQAAQDWVNQQRAISAQRGLWNDQGITPKGAVDAASQTASMLAMATTAPGRSVRLYHGTNDEGLAAINAEGKIRAPAFFMPSKHAAQSYGEHTVAVDVPLERLKIDHDLPGSRLLSVAESNDYIDRPEWTIDDYLRAGHAVGVEGDVPIR